MSQNGLACVPEDCPTRRIGVVTVRPVSRTTRALAAAAISLTVLIGSLPVTAAQASPSAPTAAAKRKSGNAATLCAPEAITPGAFPRARYLWTQLRLAGYSPEASAGVVGVLDYRSALAPMAISQEWLGYGIAQWSGERWAAYVASVEAQQANRWSPKRQVLFLVGEMATDPATFDNATFRTMTDAVAAARTFRQTYYPTPADEVAVTAMAARAQQWLELLKDQPLVELDPALTNGLRVPCTPASGAVLDRCPMVPDSFKSSFRAFTGFDWNRLSPNTQMLSRCVYTNFPYIQSQGTYSGHSPVWSQAIDFFMPSGCTYRNGSPMTRSATDLAVGKRLARYLIANAGRIGVDYIIFQDHIRNPDEHAGENQWRRVSRWRRDNYNNGDCVNTHYDHLHASTYGGSAWSATSVRKPDLNPDGKPW